MNNRQKKKLANLKREFQKLEGKMINLSFKLAEMEDFDCDKYNEWCEDDSNYEWMTLVTDSPFQQNAQELEAMFDYMTDVENDND